MSDNLIMLSIVLVVLAGIAIPFIRKAISHRKAIGGRHPRKRNRNQGTTGGQYLLPAVYPDLQGSIQKFQNRAHTPGICRCDPKSLPHYQGRQNDCHRLCGQGAGGAFYGTCGRYRPPLQGKTR